MEQNYQLNNLVIKYQDGDKNAINDICETVLPLIEKASENIWYKIRKQTDFECRCILKIKRAARNFEPSRGNFISLVHNIITHERSDFTERRRRKLDESSYETLAGFDEESDQGYQFKDVLADVAGNTEGQVIFQEKIALLAQGDSEKLFILTEWSKCASDTAIAEVLANRKGKTLYSQKMVISRFRTKCQKLLTSDKTI